MKTARPSIVDGAGARSVPVDDREVCVYELDRGWHPIVIDG